MIVKCAYCGKPKEVRAADVKRGWGKYCSKSCKAKEQEKRTGQYAALREQQENSFLVNDDMDQHFRF